MCKGQLISKANCQAVNSSKKRTNEFVFTTMRRVFVCFLEEIEDSKKAFRNYLTFRSQNCQLAIVRPPSPDFGGIIKRTERKTDYYVPLLPQIL